MNKKEVFIAEEVNNKIVSWLKCYAEQANASGFVIGISGGIDSAVTSTLCAQTGLKLLCVELPIHQPITHVIRSKEHIKFLKSNYKNINDIEIDLTPVFESFINQISEVEITNKLDLSLANTRSRLRMTTLYYLAGLHNMLVAGTGNKIEDFGVGFFTKYGDGGVDLSPIADLMKSEVFALGKFLNVPETILKATPSDGLFEDDRSDEAQLGASYDELEWAMIENENGKTSADFSGRQQTVFEIFQRLNTINKHKVSPIPVCKIR